MRYIILGSTSFVGKSLIQNLRDRNEEVITLNSTTINFLDEATFINYTPLNGDLIIDCIARIDGVKDKIYQTNVYGLQNFLDYLNLNNTNYSYIYISTISTLDSTIIIKNDYVNSKFQAERIVESHARNFKIVRLVFPFGYGESPNRLISKLIQRIKNNEVLSVANVILNLTPILFLSDNFLSIIQSSKTHLNISSEVELSLIDIVEFIKLEVDSTSTINISNEHETLTIKSDINLNCKESDIYGAISEML
ncbi:MAG: NAD(P)-dependent oxidoreductase [Pseudarcicella sp.]|nr:NAD(P)-dependent oxidoreductase [Pseudarcicella sp.]